MMKENDCFIEYLKEIGFEWNNQFNYHITNNNLTTEEYRVLKKHNFISSIPKNSTKIYLDLNVWINFRDVHMGKKPSNSKWNDIYQKAIYLNEFYDVYFVTSLNIYSELQKQDTSENFIELLKIIGKLSKELTVENPLQLVFDETFFCLMDMLKVNKSDFDFNSYQWDKASAIYGMPFINVKNSNDAVIAMNKTLIDAIYQIPFRDCYKLFEFHNQGIDGFKKVSDELNQDLAYKKGVRSKNLEELYIEEFHGAIEASSEIINSALVSFMKWYYDTTLVEIKVIKEKELINIFSNLFRYGKIQQYFPSLQIHSGLHASVRYDKSKKFTPNDLFDFHHASSAIPYCDYFVTDNPLAQRLINKPLAIGKKFDTRILPAKTELILQVFDEMLNNKA
ncbi:hypothetical protein Ga0466249_003942 [Sporomusaceae bacterium BoRhaA]|uniref:hypothetical protein n=1 Tax=Pelorhabdus rhamnosifermentans TaxID=2772457 RepID=UPI001C060A47|nr:hypothetical protein [Pelorhabdus rhamnosifermentans]MBU2702807.1 hypothetical protein [Pelorhabdus rhamnosifermentans]